MQSAQLYRANSLISTAGLRYVLRGTFVPGNFSTEELCIMTWVVFGVEDVALEDSPGSESSADSKDSERHILAPVWTLCGINKADSPMMNTDVVSRVTMLG